MRDGLLAHCSLRLLGDELAAALSTKPRIAVANKIDALDEPDRLKKLQRHMKKLKIPLYPVSAATGEGLPALLEAMWKIVDESRRADQ